MKVIITDDALDSLEEWVNFLMFQQNIPAHIVKKIHQEVIEAALALHKFPGQGQPESSLSPVGEYRRIVVRHIKVIYKISQGNIIVTDFFDSRQDPQKAKG